MGGGGKPPPREHVIEAGLDPDTPGIAATLALAGQLIGFPRHLSQHVGGFVITNERLDTLVPIGNAAMDDRTFIEWDKDDLDVLGMLKIDALALGMLSAIRRSFDLIAAHHGKVFELADVPPEDSAVYDMLCRAESIGVFQVESRAQMNMLPRLKPRDYDLVVEVAIVRPGPIQGDMVHPYLRRRNGEEPVAFPSQELKKCWARRWACHCFKSKPCALPLLRQALPPPRPTACAALWRPFAKPALFMSSGCALSMAWWRVAMSAILPSAASNKLKVLANMVFRKATPPVSRYWSMSPLGSNIITPPLFVLPSSTASPWAFTPRAIGRRSQAAGRHRFAGVH